jgi:hypothetical protein
MRSFIKSFSLTAALALASVSAFAVPTLVISDGVNTTTVLDVDADGFVSFSGTVGGWSIATSAGLTKPILGTSLQPILNLNSTASWLGTSGASNTLSFHFFEDGFMADPFQALLTGAVSSATVTGTGTVASEVNGNPYVGSAALPFNSSSNAIVNITGPALTPLTNYTLGLKTVITRASGIGAVNITASLAAVPEPGFYGALALGLSGLFAMAARRRRSAEKE